MNAAALSACALTVVLAACGSGAALPQEGPGPRTRQWAPLPSDVALMAVAQLQAAARQLAEGQQVAPPGATEGLVFTGHGAPVSCVDVRGLPAGPAQATAAGVRPGSCPAPLPTAWESRTDVAA